MAYTFVKITDLYPHTTEQVAETDLLLKASPLIGNQFVSHTCQVKDFINYILNGNKREVIEHWIFTVHECPPSTQTTRFLIDNYWHDILEHKDRLTEFLNTHGEARRIDGWNDSETSNQYAIATVDYINKLFGNVFKSISDKIQTSFNSSFNPNLIGTKYIKSSVGDFVFSNMFAKTDSYHGAIQSGTNGDSMLRYYYGYGQDILSTDNTTVIKAPDTQWKLHGKYALTGANSNVKFDKQEKTGGSETCDFTLPSHTHIVPSHTHTAKLKAEVISGKWVIDVNQGDGASKQHHGENSTHVCSADGSQPTNIPITVEAKAVGKFKSTTPLVEKVGNLAKNFSTIQPTTYFYIWERVN